MESIAARTSGIQPTDCQVENAHTPPGLSILKHSDTMVSYNCGVKISHCEPCRAAAGSSINKMPKLVMMWVKNVSGNSVFYFESSNIQSSTADELRAIYT